MNEILIPSQLKGNYIVHGKYCIFTDSKDLAKKIGVKLLNRTGTQTHGRLMNGSNKVYWARYTSLNDAIYAT